MFQVGLAHRLAALSSCSQESFPFEGAENDAQVDFNFDVLVCRTTRWSKRLLYRSKTGRHRIWYGLFNRQALHVV
jgi:hypothetical protein